MEEKDYLQRLFEKAKQEASGPSFEEVATQFKSSLGLFSSISGWFFHYSLLKYLAVFSILSTITLVCYLIIPISNTPELNKPELKSTTTISQKQTQPSPDITLSPKIESEKSNLIPIIDSTELVADASFDSIASSDFTETSTPDELRLTNLDNLPAPSLSTQLLQITPSKIPLPKPSLLPNLMQQDTIGFGTTIDTDRKKWKDQTKLFTQTYSLPSDGTTILNNQSGNIDIKTWNKDSVKITVEVKVEANKPEKIQEVLRNINIAFAKTAKTVSAKLDIKQKKAIGWHFRKNWSIRIYYEVFLPRSSNIDVTLMNGDIHCGALKGSANIDLKWGELLAEEIGNNSQIEISNGKGDIKKGGNTSCDLHFSDLTGGNLGDFNVKLNNSSVQLEDVQHVSGSGHYSELTFRSLKDYTVNGNGNKLWAKTAQNVYIDGSNAKVQIDSAEFLKAKASFGNFKFIYLKDAELDLNNTDLEVTRLHTVRGETSWSKLYLDYISSYTINSKGGEVKIKQADQIKSKGHNIKMDIGELKGDLDVDFTFGHCITKITNIQPKITAIGQNTKFFFSLPSEAKFGIDVQSNTNNYRLPNNLNVTHQIEKIGTYQVKGSLGSGAAQNLINAQLTFGKLDIALNK